MLATVRYEPIPPMVSSYTAGWGAFMRGAMNAIPASGAWEANNTGVWYPVMIPAVTVAKRMWWVNGATVSGSNNIEAGIYLDAGYKPGAKLVTTGSVAQGTLNQLQFADITDTSIAPGLCWIYMSCSTTSATFFRCTTGSAVYEELLKFQQASIGPGSAPSTATPAEASSQNIYSFGFSTTTIT